MENKVLFKNESVEVIFNVEHFFEERRNPKYSILFILGDKVISYFLEDKGSIIDFLFRIRDSKKINKDEFNYLLTEILFYKL